MSTTEDTSTARRGSECNALLGQASEALHVAVCQAVALLNRAPEVARCTEGREARDLLRQALVAYADAYMDERVTERERATVAAKHQRKPRVSTAAELRRQAKSDTSCVGAFARARPGKAYQVLAKPCKVCNVPIAQTLPRNAAPPGRHAPGSRACSDGALSKVDVLEFALEGAVTRRGVQLGNMDEEEEEDLDKDIAELEKRLAKAKESQ